MKCAQCRKAIETPVDGNTYTVGGEPVCSFVCYMNRIGTRAVLMSAEPVYDLPPTCITIVHDIGPPPNPP